MTAPHTAAAILALAGVTREDLGRAVRRRWVLWAHGQPDAAEHPSWTLPWEALAERDREADRQIGEDLFCAGWLARHGRTG
jgi:hypothetical protein